ncbi:metallophosphoesterase family protein [Saccharibacillus sp. CPCC 101409]|uniref:metallophosphoesterase family protein n=1 Tax=Saccharibacillus sp. CPCC 101409 TaxID=3058041 RepID=UPI0026712C0B|nr:metallophosphoesterase family protein [Saccharibacillus sp. CPCC 101409]MDO3410830.1 metallophosphoesterase family protein [Saccharibacillus sp. CPCC 101409]
MTQIAIISDIHGNLPALEAVLEDIESRGIEEIYCLGDLIGKGPDGDLTVDLVRRRCRHTVRGNWDEFTSQPTEYEALRWHQKKLGRERLDYLAALPFSIEFRLSGRYVRLFHASPRSVFERIQPWDDYERKLSLFDPSDLSVEPVKADVAGYGDIHNAYMQHMDGRMLFNAGSVGNPLDATQASYVILEGDPGERRKTRFDIRFARVPYDIARSIRLAVEAGMPELDAYVQELRTGRYRGLKD